MAIAMTCDAPEGEAFFSTLEQLLSSLWQVAVRVAKGAKQGSSLKASETWGGAREPGERPGEAARRSSQAAQQVGICMD